MILQGRTAVLGGLVLGLLTGCAGHGPAAVPATATSVPAPSEADVRMRRALSSALQARGADAVSLLRTIDPGELSPRFRPVRACMLERLGAGQLAAPTPTDPTLRKLVLAYETYWSGALRGRSSIVASDSFLLIDLNRLLVSEGARPATTLDETEPALDRMVQAHGFHGLFGVTSPLRELMLWRSEEEVVYEVPLPEGPQRVTVVFMDGFAALGWVGFATCDLHHSGGWTTPERLFAVKSAYDRGTEDFRVSYLAHEGQHFADARRFPGLQQQEMLEYRAKLTELAMSEAGVHDLITAFASNVSDDVASPHAYANGRVIRELTARLFPGVTTPSWRTIGPERIKATADSLLREDTARR